MKSSFFKSVNTHYQNQEISPISISLAKIGLSKKQKNQTNSLKTIPHKEVIKLMEKFLKTEYGTSFYNQFMNNFFQGQKVILHHSQKDIERISYELKSLQEKHQESSISKEYYHNQRKKLLHERKVAYLLKKNNNSYVNGLDGTIFLDIKETLEDAFVFLHEGMHRIFTQKNDKQFNSLDEIPSHAVEWQFYFFCLKNDFYVKDAQKYIALKREQMIENSTRILFEELLINCQKQKGLINPKTIEECLEEMKDEKMKRVLKEEYKTNFYKPDSGYHVCLYKYFEQYLKSYYYGLLLAKEENSSQKIIQMGKLIYEKEQLALKKVGLLMKNEKDVRTLTKKIQTLERKY